MKNLIINTDPRFEEKIHSYSKAVNRKLSYLRNLILETAAEQENIKEIEETLKWGEPSFLVKKGSTIRIDWKSKAPDQYALYFKCTSKLVKTFKEVYGDKFKYEKTRALLFNLSETPPKKEVKECIKAALLYHHVKDIPELGINK